MPASSCYRLIHSLICQGPLYRLHEHTACTMLNIYILLQFYHYEYEFGIQMIKKTYLHASCENITGTYLGLSSHQTCGLIIMVDITVAVATISRPTVGLSTNRPTVSSAGNTVPFVAPTLMYLTTQLSTCVGLIVGSSSAFTLSTKS